MPELMDIAEKLFVAQGYQHTMVSDIVKQAKVAQGSFYLMKQCTRPTWWQSWASDPRRMNRLWTHLRIAEQIGTG